MLKILSFIIVFGGIVFFHELGHFLLAKFNKIQVNEFAVGMGPAIAKWEKGETTYSIRMLPLGGYCLMEGEMDDSENENAFSSKSVGARLAVMAAGPVFNFILAFILSIIICHNCLLDPAVLTEVVENSAAEDAGLMAGDEIIKLNGGTVHLFRELTLFRMVADPTKPVNVTYKRDGNTYDTTVQMKYDEETGAYMFGVISRGVASTSFLEELKFSLYEVRFQIETVIYSVKMMFTGKATVKDLSGPVGIGQMMSDVIDEAEARGGLWDVILNVINFAVLISANLGVMNLLPIPALDGGRILFLLVEAITGKKIPEDKMVIVNLIGFVLLMILMVVVFYNDIRKLIG